MSNLINIPDKYHNFLNDKRILMVVLGQKNGKIYSNHEAQIEPVQEFELPKPQPDDKPGRLLLRSKGRTWKHATVKEHRKETERTEFVHLVVDQVKQQVAEHSLSEIWVFSPSVIKNSLKENWPSDIKEKITLTIEGTFTNKKPLELLEKAINELQTKQVKIAPKEEARKILKKSEEE